MGLLPSFGNFFAHMCTYAKSISKSEAKPPTAPTVTAQFKLPGQNQQISSSPVQYIYIFFHSHFCAAVVLRVGQKLKMRKAPV